MSMPTSAMILAAGRGERMRPLTDDTPKPLLKVKGQPLISYHLRKLAAVGIQKVVINHGWLGEQIESAVGDGSQFDVQIQYSPENPVLETAGGIVKALPLLGDKPFLVVNGDVWTDFSFESLNALGDSSLAKLVMVPNPEHHPQGDFCVVDEMITLPENDSQPTYTFSGIALYRPEFFYGLEVKRQPLAPTLKRYIGENRVAGLVHQGVWCDVGTPERLAGLNQE